MYGVKESDFNDYLEDIADCYCDGGVDNHICDGSGSNVESDYFSVSAEDAIWTIEVVPNRDYSVSSNVENDEYVFYVLKAHSDSFTKPSEVYQDFNKILDWYKTQINSFIGNNEK